MKVLQSLALVVAAAISAAASVSAEPKQVFHVTAPRSVFDAAKGKFDIWRASVVDGDKIKADVYATEAEIALFQQNNNGKYELFANQTLIERDPVNTEQLLKERAAIRAKCTANTREHLNQLSESTKYVDNAFFDCFRQSDEVFAFFDALVDKNPNIFSKIENITTTYEGRTVPGYKISTGTGRKPLYTQALIHAREWVAGSSTFFVMAGLLDGLRAGDAAVTAIFNEYEWHFVPILNIDGYRFSWSDERYWRKNRRPITGDIYGVDLNRNYPPDAYWGLEGAVPEDETYAGASVLSEPETSGSYEYVKTLQPYGAIDMHAYAGEILRAYGNKEGTPPPPYGPKLKVLGDAMAAAAGPDYISQTSAQLYVAYGCFDDAIFQELNKPTFTIEMEGDDFVADESTIRKAGNNMYRAFVAFAEGMPEYWRGL